MQEGTCKKGMCTHIYVCVCVRARSVTSCVHTAPSMMGLGSLRHSLHNWDPTWNLQRVFSGRLLLPPAASGSGPAGKCLSFPSLVNFRELPRRFPLFALSFTLQAPHTAGKFSEHQGKKWSRYEQWRHWERKGRCANTCSVKIRFLSARNHTPRPGIQTSKEHTVKHGQHGDEVTVYIGVSKCSQSPLAYACNTGPGSGVNLLPASWSPKMSSCISAHL